MSFSPDGQILAFATAGLGESHVIELWDVTNYQDVCSLSGHKDDVEAVAFSPDGNLVASGGGRYDARVLLWNPDNGKFLAVATDDGIVLFDVKTGEFQERLEGFTDLVYKVLFSNDGRYLAASSERIVRIYDGFTWKEIHTLTVGGSSVTSFAFLPDSQALAVETRNTNVDATNVGFYNVGLWNIESGTLLVELQGPAAHFLVTVSPDGQWIVSAEDSSCSSTECMIFVWSLPRLYP